MSTDLEQQIAELKAKHELQQSVEAKLPNEHIYTNLFDYDGHKFTMTVHLQDAELDTIQGRLKKIVEAYPPTENAKTVINGKNKSKTLSPYLLKFRNETRGKLNVQLEWISGEFWVHVDLPLQYYSLAVAYFNRKIYDTQYHYFVGVSMAELRNITVRAATLSDPQVKFHRVPYYGGDVHWSVINKQHVKEFEDLVLNGKID